MQFQGRKIRVKFVTRGGTTGSNFAWAGQCPQGKPYWGECEFIADPGCRNYDWLVVLDDLPRALSSHREELACPSGNTILVTSEPSSVTYYGRAFASQFGWVLTNQEEAALPHPNAIRSQTGNIWFYGKTFDEVLTAEPPAKTRSISTVCSSKRQAHTMHARRYDFTQRLKQALPDMEIFGHGVRYIDTKAEALDNFRFHLAIENHRGPHLWTEKLADAFLGFSVPIYCGCPNVLDYFPEESVIPVDIDNFEEALTTIRHTLSTEEEYTRRLPAVIEARKRVIHEYNMPAMIHRIITEHGPATCEALQAIHSRRSMRFRNPGDLTRFAVWNTGNYLHKLVRPFKP